jgi:hypothetical protein
VVQTVAVIAVETATRMCPVLKASAFPGLASPSATASSVVMTVAVASVASAIRNPNATSIPANARSTVSPVASASSVVMTAVAMSVVPAQRASHVISLKGAGLFVLLPVSLTVLLRIAVLTTVVTSAELAPPRSHPVHSFWASFAWKKSTAPPTAWVRNVATIPAAEAAVSAPVNGTARAACVCLPVLPNV